MPKLIFSINKNLQIINKLENGHAVNSFMREYEISDQIVHDIKKRIYVHPPSFVLTKLLKSYHIIILNFASFTTKLLILT